MPKYTVTPNMGAALRNLRQKRDIKAIDVAKKIDKTGAYISKLEKGLLNTIAEKDLIGIIRAVSHSEEEFNEAIDLLFQDTTKIYTDEEIEHEEWLMNMDLFYRKIPIPPEYVNLIKEKMETANVSVSELVQYINANYELYNNDTFSKEEIENAEKNHWIFNNGKSFIVIDISEDDVNAVLSGKAKSANYSLFMCLLLTLHRFEKMPNEEAYEATYKKLAELKIFTLREKEDILRSYDNIQNMHSILDHRNNPNLPEADRKLFTSLNDFVEEIQYFSNMYGTNYSREKVEMMVKNISNDPVLFMGYIGIDLERLHNCDFQIKKDFIQAVRALVDEYSVKEPKEKHQELL